MSRSLQCGNRTISAVLLDVTGVLYESGEGGGKVIEGSPEAVERYTVQRSVRSRCKSHSLVT